MTTLTSSISPAAVSVPEVPGLPLVGNFLAFRRDRLALHDEAATLGPIARIRLGPLTIYIVTDAELAHDVLTTQADAFIKSAELHFLDPLFGDGLLTADGVDWKRHRKLLAPAFAPKRLAAYGTTMVDETKRQLASWQDGATVDVARELMELTLTIAGRTLFHADVRSDAPAVARGVDLAMHAVVDNLRSPIRLGYQWPLPRNLKMRRAVTLLDDVVYRVIAEGRAHGGDRGDVLSLLLLARDEDGRGLTDREVRDEVMTLLLAGHETTANALAWTWHELGRNADVLAKLQVEIAREVGARDVTTDDLPRMPWSLAVIEEAMRLHPPAYMTGRQTTRDIELGRYSLPTGSMVAINIRGIHRRPEYFPQPDVFRPERMLPEAKKSRPRHHYLPFGAGPRVCIGSHFALLEAQLLLITMAQRARIEPLAAEVEPEPLVTLRPRGGIPARVYLR
jgi:cytochrome P450